MNASPGGETTHVNVSVTVNETETGGLPLTNNMQKP